MDRRARGLLALLFAGGLVLRLLLVATTDGSAPDLAAFRGVRDVLASDPLQLYSLLNGEGRFTWPYLPGYLPVVELTGRVAAATDVAFERLLRLPPVLADLAIAWLVQWHLGWRGADARTRLAAAALLVLSPVGIAFTAAHGQVDPVEWLPVVIAVIVWERMPQTRRALVAGLLLGLAVAIKTPAALALVGLLGLADGWGERVRLVVAAAVIPALAVAPFLLADPDGLRSITEYTSIAGQGGISLLVQPDLALARFAGTGTVEHSGVQTLVQDLGPPLTVLAVAALGFWIHRHRPDTAVAVALPILAALVVGGNFVPLYAIWFLSFAVLAGWWRFVLGVHVLSLFVLPFKYLPAPRAKDLGLSDGRFYDVWTVEVFYIPAAIALLALCALRIVATLRAPQGAAWAAGAGTGARSWPPRLRRRNGSST